MSKPLGNWNEKTVNKLRQIVGEGMLGQLVEAECLYYTLTDKLGLGNEEASKMALRIFKGGEVVDAFRVQQIIKEESKAHQLNTRQASRFTKRFMNSSRIVKMETNRGQGYQWQMNGFRTNQPPYIAGYEREMV